MGRRFRQSGYRRICTRFRWFINGAVYESGQSHIELFDNGIINRWPQSRAPSTAHEVVVSIKWVKDGRHLVPHLVTFGQSCQNVTNVGDIILPLCTDNYLYQPYVVRGRP
jgi:hypothetical protein